MLQMILFQINAVPLNFLFIKALELVLLNSSEHTKSNLWLSQKPQVTFYFLLLEY